MNVSSIAFFASLWRFMQWVWSILILGVVIGVLGNATFTYFSTGKLNFADPRTLTVIALLNAYLWLVILVAVIILALTVFAFQAYRQQNIAQQKRATEHDDALVTLARGVLKALEEPNDRQPASIANPPSTPTKPEEHEPPVTSRFNLPYRRNPFFTGREELIQRLRESLEGRGAAALTQPQAISGLGGIGKTQVALEYAYRYRDTYQCIFWVTADKRETLIDGFVAIARLLKLPERDAQDQHITVEAIKTWLAEHHNWLLILDNADDLPLLDEFLPTTYDGHIVLTTREAVHGQRASGIEVKEMNQDEGVLFLLRRAGILKQGEVLEKANEEDRAQAAAIVTALGGLPLALDQAGAYIEEKGCRLSTYLDIYQRRQAALLKERGRSSLGHSEPVAATWSLNFEQVAKVEQIGPLAADLLRFCAFLAPDAIPESLIIKGAGELGEHLQAVATEPGLLDEAIGALRHYSLVQRNRDEQVIFVHRLVQAVLKASMDNETQRRWAERTVRAVNQAFPGVSVETWPLCQQYLPHALACADLIQAYGFQFNEAARLLNQAACYLDDHARYPEAEPLYRRASEIWEKVLGPEHPDTASCLNNLAGLYRAQGRYKEAEPLYRRALEIKERVLGPEHPATALSLNNLAALYKAQGKYEKAEPLYRRALQIFEKVLGPEHPDTARSLNNLAALYDDQGKYEEAEPLYRRALKIGEKMLGLEHPDTANSLNNLAGLYRAQGRYKEAEPLYRRALEIKERVLGPEHPHTAASLNNLAALYDAQGKYEQAEPLYRRALRICEKVLGPEHPWTVSSLNNLAALYDDQGKYEEAEPLYRRALEIDEKVLGPEHPDTATSLNNLAGLYYAQGKYEKAEPLYRRALEIREKVLGPEHPDTAQSLNNLAGLYRAQGKYEEAEPLYRRALQICEKVFGPEHPHTKTVRENYERLMRERQAREKGGSAE